uniref:LLGL domain-containing protein n=1 Tax=Macrostomum lignano TaxID=282301 RepID=A0A1I8JLR6_9PLAT
ISHAYLPVSIEIHLHRQQTRATFILLNIESFKVSGYDIKWNKAIGIWRPFGAGAPAVLAAPAVLRAPGAGAPGCAPGPTVLAPLVLAAPAGAGAPPVLAPGAGAPGAGPGAGAVLAPLVLRPGLAPGGLAPLVRRALGCWLSCAGAPVLCAPLVLVLAAPWCWRPLVLAPLGWRPLLAPWCCARCAGAPGAGGPCVLRAPCETPTTLATSKLLIGFRKGLTVLVGIFTSGTRVRFRHTEDLRAQWPGTGSGRSCFRSARISTGSAAQPPPPSGPSAGVSWLSRKAGQSRAAAVYRRRALRSGRMPQPCLNIQAGRHIDVLMMEHAIIDIVPLCESPFPNFENPYPMDLHDSPVTACHFVADCPHKLIENCFMVGRAQKQSQGFSQHSWPVTGGKWGDSKTSYSEILITGHADGSVKFWNASLMQLQALYRLRTSKYFESSSATTFTSQTSSTSTAAAATAPMPTSSRAPPSRQASLDTESSTAPVGSEESAATPTSSTPSGPGAAGPRVLPPSLQEESPHAVQLISLAADGQKLLLSANGYACLLTFNRRETCSEISTVDVCIEPSIEESSADCHDDSAQQQQQQRGSSGSQQNIGFSASFGSPKLASEKELWVTQAVKRGKRRWSPGYQPELICRLATACPECQPAPILTAKYSAEYQILAIGNENGVGLIDSAQGCLLLTLCTPDLHGTVDAGVRNLRSPSYSKKDDRMQSSEQVC